MPEFFYDSDIFYMSAFFDGSPGKKHFFTKDLADLDVQSEDYTDVYT